MAVDGDRMNRGWPWWWVLVLVAVVAMIVTALALIVHDPGSVFLPNQN
jgi:hypothetical protein